MKVRHIVGGYLVMQAIAVVAWWALLWRVPAVIVWFHPEAWPDQALLGFWLADGTLLVAGSLLVAALVWRSSPWAAHAVWALAAAVAYPTLYCFGSSVLTGEAWIASAAMSGAAGLTLAMATIYGNTQQQPATIRVTPMPPAAALAWTAAQTVVFWGVFLWIIPQGIVEFETRLGLSRFGHRMQRPNATGLFAAASALGLWSGIAMSLRGRGTPLPTAAAPELVTSGPYRFVRNPMALAGITQGVAVGWYLGSAGVIGYAFCGALAWHIFVRPVEQADLQRRFGDSYAAYRRAVWLWIPRRPHSILPDEPS